jgi:hypothetical protein
VLRTHVMRPTWHFVTAADIRWLVALSAPRLRRVMLYYLRQHGIDDKTRIKSMAVLERELRGGKYRTRAELAQALVTARVASSERLLTHHVMGHILGWAEVEALVCSGPRRGKQFTYALLDERVRRSPPLSRDESLAELAKRYFTSHGPATLRDFTWWSGLTTKEARTGATLAEPSLAADVHQGVEYWHSARPTRSSRRRWRAQLLPTFDEYIVAYADRSALMDAAVARRFGAKSSGLLTHTMVLDGRIVGTWTRAFKERTADLALHALRPLDVDETEAIDEAVGRFCRFAAPLQVRVARTDSSRRR